MKDSVVKIVAYSDEANFGQSQNENFLLARVESEEVSVSNGILVLNKRVAFTALQKDAIEMLGLKPGKTFPGRIIVMEQEQPFYDGQQPKAKVDDNGNILGYAVSENGLPVFRQTQLVAVGSSAEDKFVPVSEYRKMNDDELDKFIASSNILQESEEEDDDEEEEVVEEVKPKTKAKPAPAATQRSRRK